MPRNRRTTVPYNPRPVNALPPSLPAPRAWIALAALAAVAVIATYWQTLFYELAYDDYFLTRPWTWTQLERVWHGTWDPTRISVRFYRPITAWWYALRFELFGLNGLPQHLVSLAGMTVCATLAGLFVWRDLHGRAAAAVTTLLYAIHPAMAYGQAAWLTNQMHLLASLLVLLGLLAWQFARSRGPIAWIPVALVQIAAFGVKEDTIMLAPAVLGLTLLRRVLVADIQWPHWSVWLAGAALPVALYAFRLDALGAIGGYGAHPDLGQAWSNFSTAFRVFTLEPVRRPWQGTASVVAQAVLVCGGAAALFHRLSAYRLLTGIGIFAAFNLPFILVTKAEQMHLVAFGVVLTLAAAAGALVTWPTRRSLQWTMAAIVVIPLLSLAPVARHVASDFGPCSRITLATDQTVLGWAVVPHEVHAWLRDKPAACASNSLRPMTRTLETATWAHWPEVDDAGVMFQWTSERATILVRPEATDLILRLRRPDASAEHPVDVTIDGPVSSVRSRLADADWQGVTIRLTPTLRSRLAGMHRVDLRVAQTFVPSARDPKAGDNRRLGVHLRVANTEP
jgi:hypothetical protein